MRRFSWLLIPLLWLLAACGSGADQFSNPTAVAGPGEDSPPTATVRATTAADSTAVPAANADDPTQARERDWKQGDLEDPAVTIIEYGDFQ
ncbi:MAG TPA: hypothetical protein PK829_01130 [Promineifilum sp.]|nr:hypothetical protein [Promineifilum sp.]